MIIKRWRPRADVGAGGMLLDRRRLLAAAGLGAVATLVDPFSAAFGLPARLTTWTGTKKIAFLPVYRSIDPVPPDWSQQIDNRINFDSYNGSPDLSLRAFLRAASYGRADLTGSVLPPVYFPDEVIPVDAFAAQYEQTLRGQGFDGAYLVTLGGVGAGTAQPGGFWARVAMAENVGVWAMEITHVLTDYGDLYVYANNLDIFDNMASAYGTHPSAYTKRALGWLDDSAIAQHSGPLQFHDLHTLALPQPAPAGLFKAVRVGPGTDPLMIEARQGADQFDSRIPADRQGVIVYEVTSPDTGINPADVTPSLLLRTWDGLTPGQAFVSQSRIEVRVVAARPDGYTVRVVDQAQPLINPIGDFSRGLGDPLWLQFSLATTEYAVTWSATGVPPGTTLDPVSGVLSGNIVQPGIFAVTYTAVDTYGYAVGSSSFTCVVRIPSPAGAQIAIAQNALGWLPLYAIGAGDSVLEYQPNIPGWFRFDGALRCIAAELNADGRAEIFGVTGAGTIFHRSQNHADQGGALSPWGPWTQLDGILYSIAAARNTDGRIELFGSNDLGQVFHRSQAAASTSNNWTPWVQLDGPGMVKVAAETNLDGRIELFGLDGAGHIFHRAQLTAGGASGWSAWTPLDGTLSTIAVAASNDRLELFGTVNGNIFHRTQASPGSADWTPWVQFDGSLVEIGARSTGGHIELVGTNSAGLVFYRYQSTAGSWAGTNWVGLGAATPATVVVPNVHSQTQANAITALTNTGLAIGIVSSTSVNEGIDAGKVVTQTPAAGTRVAAGTAVNLSIGVYNGSHL